MATGTRKGVRAVIVKPDAVDQAMKVLGDLPEKPKEDFSLREAVDKLQESLRAALNKGYTYQDLAKMLTDQGIKISALTLKNYVPSGKRSAGKTKARRSKKENGVTDESPAETQSEVEEKPSTSAESDAPAPKKTRGRTKEASSTSNTSGRANTKRAAAKKTATEQSTAKAPTTRRRKQSAT